MQKLYKRISGVLHYHEAWAEQENGVVVEHWGQTGEQGETKNHPLTAGEDEDEAITSVLSNALSNGYEPFDEDDMHILLVEYTVDGMGNKQDLEKRQALEDLLNESLGWTGLGHCDGGSIGSGTMEACCYVVDFSTAKKVLEKDLGGGRFGDYTRIYEED